MGRCQHFFSLPAFRHAWVNTCKRPRTRGCPGLRRALSRVTGVVSAIPMRCFPVFRPLKALLGDMQQMPAEPDANCNGLRLIPNLSLVDGDLRAVPVHYVKQKVQPWRQRILHYPYRDVGKCSVRQVRDRHGLAEKVTDHNCTRSGLRGGVTVTRQLLLAGIGPLQQHVAGRWSSDMPISAGTR